MGTARILKDRKVNPRPNQLAAGDTTSQGAFEMFTIMWRLEKPVPTVALGFPFLCPYDGFGKTPSRGNLGSRGGDYATWWRVRTM